MRCFLLLAATLAAASPAVAEDDVQGWSGIIASGAVKGDLFVWAEGQARLTDDFGGGSQFIVRPAIGARIARDAHAVIGYAYVRTDPEGGRTTNEQRVWQQVQFVAARNRAGAPLVISRTRLEQRMIEGREETGWRLRQFVRFQAPIARAGRVQAVAYTEGFVNLNATDAGARRGIDQWRNFVGIGLPLAPKLRIEPGYLNQTIFRAGENRSNHIANVALFLSL